jgi:rod shape-determining protein MreC
MTKRKGSGRFIYSAAVVLLVAALFFVWNQTRFNFAFSAVSKVQKKTTSSLFHTPDASGRPAGSSNKELNIVNDKNMLLESENQTLKSENEKLKRLITLKSGKDFRQSVVCLASVIGANDDGFIYFYTIDRGTDDGISEGDGVITMEGAVGRVYKVSNSTAMVQLITDAKSSVSSRDERSRVTGILSGINQNRCSINYIPKEEDVKEGDSIITSGLGKSFPEGVKIGKVVEANKKVDGLSMIVKVKPFVDFMSVEEVIIVRKK